jgi:hypothetical protein
LSLLFVPSLLSLFPMSRRRFGDADDTYKDFISAIDDHKRKRQQAATVRQQQQAQPVVTPSATPVPSTGSLNYSGAPATVGVPSGSYSILPEESANPPSQPTHYGLGFGVPDEDADDFRSNLPVNLVDRDPYSARDFRRMGVPHEKPALSGYQMEDVLSEDASLLGGGEGSGLPTVPEPGGGEQALFSKRNLDLLIQKKR